MKIRILTITHKVPTWVNAGFTEYAKRLGASFPVELIEVPAEKRSANATHTKIIAKEGEKLLSHIKAQHCVIALDLKGEAWSTMQLTQEIKQWQQQGRNVDLLIGGPDGLAPACLLKAERKWSLSPLTFPHFIVRIIIAEQLYRAHSILQNHPYHR